MTPRYEYAIVNASHYPNAADAANQAAKNGWRTVAVIPSPRTGYAETLLVEKEIYPELIMLKGPEITLPEPPKKRKWFNLKLPAHWGMRIED